MSRYFEPYQYPHGSFVPHVIQFKPIEIAVIQMFEYIQNDSLPRANLLNFEIFDLRRGGDHFGIDYGSFQ